MNGMSFNPMKCISMLNLKQVLVALFMMHLYGISNAQTVMYGMTAWGRFYGNFSSPGEAAAKIEELHLAWPFTNPVEGGPIMHCPASATPVSESSFTPTNPPGTYSSVITRNFTQQTTVCTSVQNAGTPSSKCIASACAAEPAGTQHIYEIYAVCPNGTALQAGPVCKCPEGETYSKEKGICMPFKDRYKGSVPNANFCPFGRPIFPLTGSKRQGETLGQWLGQAVQAVYDTRGKVPSNDENLTFSAQPLPSFGGLWQSSLHKRLVMQSGPRPAIQASRGGTNWVSFVGDGMGHFVTDADTPDTLGSAGGGWRYLDIGAKAAETYDGEGKLQSVAYASGKVLNYVYSDASTPVAVAPVPGLLIKVQDALGRSVQFQYEQPVDSTLQPRLKSVTDPAGQQIGFIHDAANNLKQINWPDGKARKFLYENLTFPWALTGVVDENAARVTTYAYDSAGRAVETQAAGGVDHFKATYGTPPTRQVTETYDAAAGLIWRDHTWLAPQNTMVTLSNGQTTTLSASLVQGVPRLTSNTHPQGSGCLAATSYQSYDNATGNVIQRDDFNQHRTCYAYDGGNRETGRVEGLANTVTCDTVVAANAALPAGSRKVSTEWHADWRLEKRRAEPGRLTTLVYNGQPDPFNSNIAASCAPVTAKLPDGKPIAVLCRQIEQATTDVDGRKGFSATLQAGVANRVSSWTYDQNGQVLTSKGPRTDVNDMTTYVYYNDTTVDHTLGDLKQITSATGEVTQFTKYNKHGQVLESKDGNGVLTVNTYDLRQRLKSSSVAGLKTTYDYDAVGQLKKITRPDSSWIGFDYDDAHRQKAVYDHLSNRIDYTLDNEGNRKVETVKDVGGVLKRQLTRSIDALGRVQQTTGLQ